jgi:beta-N-acetylhexosaminidase
VRRLLTAVLPLVALVAACGGSSADDGNRATAAPPTTTTTTTTTPPCSPASLEDRAATTLLVGLPGVASADAPLAREVAALGVGGILLTETNVAGADQARALVAGLRAASPRPVLIAVDDEGGRVSSTQALAPRGPSARRLGAAGTDAARSAGRALGATLASIDVDVALAPVADLDGGPAGGVIGDRSFGTEPAAVAGAATAFAAGLRESGIAPTAKHFPGHAGAADSHDGPATVDRSVDALEGDLVPFRALVDDDVPMVMLGHVAYSGLGPMPASLEPGAYRLLRDTGFEGVAVTDSLGMGAINLRWPFPEAAVRAVLAGADLALTTDGSHARSMRDELVSAVRVGRLPEARLDEAASRVLRMRGEDPTSMVCPD